MSLATLKKKSRRYFDPLSGKGKDGFSLNGGHRNIGYIGQNLGKSVKRTREKFISTGVNSGASVPQGHGGKNGQYIVQIYNSGSCNTNDSSIIKPSSKTNSGLLSDNKIKCKETTYPNNWVKNKSFSNMGNQSDYIQNKSNANSVCVTNLLDSSSNKCQVTYIGTTKRMSSTYSKNITVNSCSQYQNGHLQSKKCLPTPSNMQPFPMMLNKNYCMDEYMTPQEAIDGGALPADWMQ